VGERVPTALVEFARGEKATQIVIGASRRSRWQELVRGSVVARIVREAQGFDVHVIAQGDDDGETLPLPSGRHRRRRPTGRRQLIGWALALVGLPVLTAVLVPFRDNLTLATDLMLFLVATVAIAAIGGFVVAVFAALFAFLLSNWYFVPPIHTFTIGDPENVTALVVFVVSAVVASALVDRVASRSREALRARAEAAALARTSGLLIAAPDPLPQLLDQLRTTFGLEAVSLLSNRDDGWVLDAAAGDDPPTEPFEGERWDLVDDGSAVLVPRGAQLTADDQRVLRTFLSNLALALHARRLRADAEVATHLADADALRTALLQAVSHDLRTPLASIKASATSLLQSDVAWTPEQRREFARTIDTEADRLNRVVTNLLDMSRLQAGAVNVASRPVYLEDVVAAALASLDHDPRQVTVAVPETVPPVEADPALLERAVANIVANALAWSPPDGVVRIEAAPIGDRVHLRVIDRGPGVQVADRERVFRPFQRLGDRGTQAGVGLGLAVARGFVQVLGGEVLLEDTPGGGLTVVFDLPVTPERAEVPVS
jgi:two-component system, OmpR family, sensor histidine kinase KdpD